MQYSTFHPWCFWMVVLEKTLRSPLDGKEIKPVNPKGNQSWIFIGRTDAEAETLILCPPDLKNWFIAKYPDAGKDGRQEEKGTREVEMVGWHHWLKGHEFEQSFGSWWWTGKPGVLQSMGLQRVGHDWATELNWTELNIYINTHTHIYIYIYWIVILFSDQLYYLSDKINWTIVWKPNWTN